MPKSPEQKKGRFLVNVNIVFPSQVYHIDKSNKACDLCVIARQIIYCQRLHSLTTVGTIWSLPLRTVFVKTDVEILLEVMQKNVSISIVIRLIGVVCFKALRCLNHINLISQQKAFLLLIKLIQTTTSTYDVQYNNFGFRSCVNIGFDIALCALR